MRSYDPNDEYDVKELADLNAQDWQVNAFSLNPSYVCWGPYEDYMAAKGNWGGPLFYDDWNVFRKEFGDSDELNECVNFYFQLDRPSTKCTLCENGRHGDTVQVYDSFYEYKTPFSYIRNNDAAYGEPSILPPIGQIRASLLAQVMDKYNDEFKNFCNEMKVHRYWSNRISPEEIDYLWENDYLSGLFRNKPDVTILNSENGKWCDSIRREALINYRIKKFGMPLCCDNCKGKGGIYANPDCNLSVVFWIIHPRKGCSRGILVHKVAREDFPDVLEFLKKSHERNTERFSKALALV